MSVEEGGDATGGAAQPAPVVGPPAVMPSAVGLHSAINSNQDDWNKYVELLEHYFTVREAQANFNLKPSVIVKGMRHQGKREVVATYVAELRKIAEFYDYNPVLSDLLRDCLVVVYTTKQYSDAYFKSPPSSCPRRQLKKMWASTQALVQATHPGPNDVLVLDHCRSVP